MQFGAILGLIVSFFHLIAQTMRRRSTPRSRLRRRRIAKFDWPNLEFIQRSFTEETKMTPQAVEYKELSESGNHDREFGPV